MDKLSADGTQRVSELIEQRGAADVVFLPWYSSPDLNPIEEAFSKIKGLLRKAGARTKEELIEAIAQTLSAVTPEDAEGCFRHCGYMSRINFHEHRCKNQRIALGLLTFSVA